MPTYVYETIPESGTDAPQRFELRQSMSEPSLTVHPDTGAPVRRVLSGGLATFTEGPSSSRPGPAGGCGTGCGCVS
ncbi:MAG: zinc ribbon domain-containing protein [Gemmatimonadaceae bacterium]|nr:zinc ribbon domain-containing protein [Gemmatimonadaceae bacterium]